MLKIIAEVTYDFYSNTISRDNNIQIVTEENEKSYYCQAIGTPFKKDKENKVRFIVGELYLIYLYLKLLLSEKKTLLVEK